MSALAVLFPPACLGTSGLPTEAINTLKMIQMNLLRKQKEAHRHRKGNWSWSLVGGVGEGGGSWWGLGDGKMGERDTQESLGWTCTQCHI